MRTGSLIAVAGLVSITVSAPASADVTSDLKTQVDALQRQLEVLKAKLDEVVQAQKQEQERTKSSPLIGSLIQQKPGDALTFTTPARGEVTLYGNLDVSIDTATKGLRASYDSGGSPVGKLGWQSDIATNLSYIGARGAHPIPAELNFVWQLEAGIDISATPGTKNTNSNSSNAVNGALFSRNSFIGLAAKDWGAVMIGKSETPYKTSTDRLNPFSNMLGD